MIHSGKTLLAGVIGWPVAHSRSPRLHGYWLQTHGIDGAYLPLAVAPERLDDALRGLIGLGFRGANVTVPHKQAVMARCDRVTDTARRIGAVNTLIVGGDGTLSGDNTDAYGFMENLRREGGDIDPGTGGAVVLGAGGAARAVCVALLDAGMARIVLLNRTRARADALAADLGDDRLQVGAWDDRDRLLAGAGVLVNTTALGMVGQPPLEISLAALPITALVTDIVYAPLETPLLAAARARGNPVVDGLGMLLHQARPGFQAWFGHDPVVDADLRRFVLEDRS